MKKILNSTPYKTKLTLSALYLFGMTILFVLPLKDLPDVPLFPGEDKLIHGSLYCVLALLLSWTFISQKKAYQKILLLVAIWGFIMEITQLLMHAGRNFSYLDMVANLTGAVVGVIAFRAVTLSISKT